MSQVTYDDLEKGISFNSYEHGPNVSFRNWKGFCLHHSYVPKKPVIEYNYASIFNHYHFYDNGWKYGLGYDFVISWSSDIIKMWSSYRWRNQINGAHALNRKRLKWGNGDIIYPNEELIGVCIVGDFDEVRPNEFLLDSANDILAKISSVVWGADWMEFNPPIFMHNQFDHKTCPGNNITIRKNEYGVDNIGSASIAQKKKLKDMRDVAKIAFVNEEYDLSKFANDMNVSERQIRKYLSGESSPSLPRMDLLSRISGIPLGDIVEIYRGGNDIS